MDLPNLRLWEQAALRPEDCSPSLWHRRSTPERRSSDVEVEHDMRRARRDRRRSHATTVRGLAFSVCLTIPVGGTYGMSLFLADGVSPDQCESLAAALTPKDQRRVREYRASVGFTPAQERALNVRVCDPTLLGMIPQLAKLVSSGEEFAAMSKRLDGVGEEVSTMNVLRALMSTEPGLR